MLLSDVAAISNDGVLIYENTEFMQDNKSSLIDVATFASYTEENKKTIQDEFEVSLKLYAKKCYDTILFFVAVIRRLLQPDVY